jgi:heme o synthase
MSSPSTTVTAPVAVISRRELLAARISAYFELSKPRIASLVLVVVAVSALVGGWGAPQPWIVLHTLLGAALVAASASTFNQIIERHRDALMARTIDRPLPSGRLSVSDALWFGIVTLAIGVFELAAWVNLLTAALGLLTWLLYVAAYTPLKARTSANTAIGAVAGALPVLMGWSAAEASFSFTSPTAGGMRAAALFLIVYLWQFPHFMAIAWIYRRQYAAADLQMLTVVDSSGRRAGAQAVLGALALFPVSVLAGLGITGGLYFVGAMTLGAAYLLAAALFCWRRDDASARRLLQISLVYLPALLVLLLMSPLL